MSDKTKFNVEYTSGICGGYRVFLNNYAWNIAVFVEEGEARDYARYRQQLLDTFDTTEIPDIEKREEEEAFKAMDDEYEANLREQLGDSG